MIQSLLSDPTVQLLEQSLNFTEQRHQVILQNIANVSTPGYMQQDVSVAGFEQALRDAVDRQRASYNGDYAPESNDDVQFVPGSTQVQVKPHATQDAMAFHDRGVRSIESLMGDLADNAIAHNTIAGLLKTRYAWISNAISMKA